MRLALDIVESAKISFSALVANKARGALTALGIIIGIVAVITTMTAANGLERTFRKSFSAVSADVVYVSRRPWVSINDGFKYRNRPRVRLEESERLGNALRGRAIVNPTVSTSRPVRFREKTVDSVTTLGTTDRQVVFSGAVPETGRFLLPFDVQYRRNVAVIGWEIKDRLFGAGDPVGSDIYIGRHLFRVIGVMEKQGGGFLGGPNFDLQVFIPVSSFVKAFGGASGEFETNIAVKSPSMESLADLEFEVIGEMRKIRRLRPDQEENFSINKLDTLIGAYNKIMGVVVMIGLMVTSISLFVGGVGVMNIMFVAVTERTREIGIRKALGARRRSILMQFLFEAGAICMFGALVGIALAWLITLLINATLMPASMSASIIVTAIVISIAVGVLAGIVPAWRGARKNPIEALRYE